MTLPTHIYFITMSYGVEAQWMAKATSSFLLILILIIYLIAFQIRKEEKMFEQITTEKTILKIINFNGWYDQKQILKNINMDMFKNKISAIIGPSGCGKTTLLRSINRINDEIPDYRASGEIYDGKNIYDKDIDITMLRKNRYGISKTCSISNVNI